MCISSLKDLGCVFLMECALLARPLLSHGEQWTCHLNVLFRVGFHVARASLSQKPPQAQLCKDRMYAEAPSLL